MLNNRKFFVDVGCEISEFTKEFQDEEFYEFARVDIIPGAIYLISRQQVNANIKLIKQLAEQQIVSFIFGNPAEGSETMVGQLQRLDILNLVKSGRILVITGGYMSKDIPNLYYEYFMSKILNYTENLNAIDEYQLKWQNHRPYKFLFLNGRARGHRQQLLHRLGPILNQAIWTNLDNTLGDSIKLLDSKYEFKYYQTNIPTNYQGFVKYQLFNNEWGDIYINPQVYNDTYFSLVTETVFDYPYSFRTEKLWKPICIGHPFVVAANTGYYRDLHNLGFRTFGHLIDESFDTMDNNQDRLERIATVVEDLCDQDLPAFITAAQDVCKYNQQLLTELAPKIRAEFSQRLINFINERSRI